MIPAEYFLANIWMIPLFPLVGAALMLLMGRRLPNVVVNIACVGSVFASMCFAFGAIWQLIQRPVAERVIQFNLFDWFPAGAMHTDAGKLMSLHVPCGVLMDPLTAVMLFVVTGVGFLIHVYSTGYMAREGGYHRFFAYMNLFMFSMLTLVLANNLLLLFVGWEGVGLCSYLLIGFYFYRQSASDAGRKAFIVNRIGDAGFLLGLFLMLGTLGTIQFAELGPAITAGHFQTGDGTLTAMALLLFVGAIGKSAQFPLYVWLPDAMEGPTPVSALIHAATMVTAGVYLLARTNAVFSMAPLALEVVAVVGGVTALFAATVGLVQNDIKRVLAYSTVSQLGYMFLACGVGAFSAGIFHLMTHAFFKALLFLGSGSIIHALSGEQDLRNMGGLWKRIPITARTFVIAALAVAGIPPLAGFFSKDAILARAFERSQPLWALGIVTAGFTAFYMFRLVNMAFFGASHVDAEVEHHIHESRSVMTIPLVILAALSVAGGWIGWPQSLGGPDWFTSFLAPVMAPNGGGAAMTSSSVATTDVLGSSIPTEYLLMAASVAIALAGMWLAYRFYIRRPGTPEKIAASSGFLYRLLYREYYVNEIYDVLIVKRVKDLALALGAFDRTVIDGLGVNGSAWLTRFASRVSIWWDSWIVDGIVNLAARFVWIMSRPVRMLQSGRVARYALVMLIGLLCFLGYYLQTSGFTLEKLLR